VLVSIIIRSYNYERFLREAIDSALAQTHPETEVVVVDDGSTDGSKAIIEEYGDRVRAVFKENEGAGPYNFEAGLAASRGQVVVFLDSDDVISSTTAAKAASILEDDGYVRVSWMLEEIDAEGIPTGIVIPRRELPEGDIAEALIKEGPVAGVGPPTSGNAWSRKFLETVFPMPEPRRGMHVDIYLHTLGGLSGKLGRIDEIGGKYRDHGTGLFAGLPLVERVAQHLRDYHDRCRWQSDFLSRAGIRHDPAEWKTGNQQYERVWRRFGVFQELSWLLPVNSKFILFDRGSGGAAVIIPQRTALRFHEADGDPRDTPPDTAGAIERLESLRSQGAQFCVFAPPGLWWFRKLDGFREYLRAHYSCEIEKEFLIVFNLTRRI
jgi:glycosyltransferase involved in cell wall biosynthesis